MGINIKDPAVESLAQELARATGQDVEQAIQQALSSELKRIRKDSDFAARKARVREIVRSFGPVPEGVTSDHSDLYDEWGLPK
jgi:antitoxin VapB